MQAKTIYGGSRPFFLKRSIRGTKSWRTLHRLCLALDGIKTELINYDTRLYC